MTRVVASRLATGRVLVAARRALPSLALWSGVGCIAVAVVATLVQGSVAWEVTRAPAEASRLALVGPALRTVIAAPLFLLAAVWARGRQTARAARATCLGFGLLVIVTAASAGPLSPAWFVGAALMLIASVAGGPLTGGFAFVLGAAAYVVTASMTGSAFEVLPGTGWVHVLTVVLTFLLVTSVGILVHAALSGDRAAQGDRRQRHAEVLEDLRQRERLLDHAMRVETLGNVASLAAHELRNHMQVMMGDAALGAGDDPEGKDRRFDRIRSELLDSTRLLEQLLQLAHPDQEPAAEVDLVDVCGEFGETLESLLPSGIEVRTELPPGAVPVVLERRGLEQALLNLVVNARHAMGAGGELALGLSSDGRTAKITVTDSGEGIPASHLERVFEPYFTTKPKGKGTGLGLAAVDRFVRAAGGEVGVASEVGGGTTFSMMFPIAGTGRRLEAG